MRITDKTSFDIANESYKKYDIGDEITVSGNDFEIIEKRDDTQNGKIYLISNFVYKI